MSITEFYTHEVDVQRLSSTEDNYGGETNTWSTNVSDYSCRIFGAKDNFVVEDMGKFEGTEYKAIGNSADIIAGDKIVDGSDEYIIKRVYKVYNKTSIHHLEMSIDKIK